MTVFADPTTLVPAYDFLMRLSQARSSLVKRSEQTDDTAGKFALLVKADVLHGAILAWSYIMNGQDKQTSTEAGLIEAYKFMEESYKSHLERNGKTNSRADGYRLVLDYLLAVGY